MDVARNTSKAWLDATDFRVTPAADHELEGLITGNVEANGDPIPPEVNGITNGLPHGAVNGNINPYAPSEPPPVVSDGENPNRDDYPEQSLRDAARYFIHEGNWIWLFGTASTWFALDFGWSLLSLIVQLGSISLTQRNFSILRSWNE
jgi:hypothetical protein